VKVFFYLYLPNPRSHVLPPLAAITLSCLAPREERKNKGEKRGDEGIPSPIVVVPLQELVVGLRIVPSTIPNSRRRQVKCSGGLLSLDSYLIPCH
jgi:hypothetical protein